MMQEVNVEADSVTQALEQTTIADQLQDAACTAVTQAETTTPASIYTVPPPSELPSNMSAPLMQSPPPPTGGFVPSPGSVTGTPSKYPTVAQSTPSHASPMGASASPYNPHVPPPSPYNPSVSQGMTPMSPSVSNPSTYPPPTAPNTQSVQSPMAPPPQANMPPPQQAYSPMQPPVGGMAGPHDGSASVDFGGDSIGPVYATPDDRQQGFMGWFSGAGFMNKVMEKTKTLSENIVTTLDPGMKQVIYSGGDVDIVVASEKEVKVGAVRQAFQEIFGRATITGQDSQPSIAPQPVGYTAGLKGCEERIEQLRRNGRVHERQVLVAVENFIVEVFPDTWFDIACVLLKDPMNNIELQTFSQATPVSSEWVQQLQDQTSSDYDLRWSGLAVTVGSVTSRSRPFVNPADWHQSFTGVSRKDMLYMAAKTLAGMYKQRLYPQM